MDKPGFTSLTPVLCVNDLAASLTHYERVLGFTRLWQWSSERAFEEPARPTFACVERGECALFLCEKGQGTPGAWICLNVCTLAELDALYAEYQQSGAAIVEPPHDCTWGMREMLVHDLDGNTFRMGAELGKD
jgi:uncharacterized glyoxalase superfamily protein PhnB